MLPSRKPLSCFLSSNFISMSCPMKYVLFESSRFRGDIDHVRHVAFGATEKLGHHWASLVQVCWNTGKLNEWRNATWTLFFRSALKKLGGDRPSTSSISGALDCSTPIVRGMQPPRTRGSGSSEQVWSLTQYFILLLWHDQSSLLCRNGVVIEYLSVGAQAIKY